MRLVGCIKMSRTFESSRWEVIACSSDPPLGSHHVRLYNCASVYTENKVCSS